MKHPNPWLWAVCSIFICGTLLYASPKGESGAYDSDPISVKKLPLRHPQYIRYRLNAILKTLPPHVDTSKTLALRQAGQSGFQCIMAFYQHTMVVQNLRKLNHMIAYYEKETQLLQAKTQELKKIGQHIHQGPMASLEIQSLKSLLKKAEAFLNTSPQDPLLDRRTAYQEWPISGILKRLDNRAQYQHLLHLTSTTLSFDQKLAQIKDFFQKNHFMYEEKISIPLLEKALSEKDPFRKIAQVLTVFKVPARQDWFQETATLDLLAKDFLSYFSPDNIGKNSTDFFLRMGLHLFQQAENYGKATQVLQKTHFPQKGRLLDRSSRLFTQAQRAHTEAAAPFILVNQTLERLSQELGSFDYVESHLITGPLTNILPEPLEI